MGTSTKETVKVDEALSPSTSEQTEVQLTEKNNLKNKIVKNTGNGVSKLTLTELELVEGISNYIEIMDSSDSLTSRIGANAQMGLYKTILNILVHEPSKFKKVYKWVVETIKLSRAKGGAFHDRKVMKYHSFMSLSTNELVTFRSLVNLLCISADIGNRKVVVERVSLLNIADSLKRPEAKNNLMNFYYS